MRAKLRHTMRNVRCLEARFKAIRLADRCGDPPYERLVELQALRAREGQRLQDRAPNRAQPSAGHIGGLRRQVVEIRDLAGQPTICVQPAWSSFQFVDEVEEKVEITAAAHRKYLASLASQVRQTVGDELTEPLDVKRSEPVDL